MSLSRDGLEFRRVMRDVDALAKRDVTGLMRLVRESSFDRGMELMRQTVPAISRTYGSVTQTVTRQFHANQRRKSGVTTPFTPSPVSYDWDDFAEGVVGFAGARIAESAPYGATTALIAGAISAELNEFSRIIIQEYGSSDPAQTGFERVTGPNPCEFCLFMASVAEASRYTQAEGRVDYHSNCSCVDVPIFEGQVFDRPASYDAMEETFGEARAHLDIMSELAREQRPDLGPRNRFRAFPEAAQNTKNIMREIRAVDGAKPFTVPDRLLGSNPQRTIENVIARNPQWSDSTVAMARALI
jgi:hypothetical protein